MSEKCELNCGNVATVKCTWGLFDRDDPMNVANLCEQHSTELWLKCAGAVNANVMYWTNSEIK